MVAALSCAAFAQHHGGKMAPSKGNENAQFVAIYKHMEALFESKNADDLYKGVAPGFTEYTMGRTVKKDQSLKGLKQFMGMFTTLHCKFTMRKCQVKGNTATTTDAAHLWGDGTMDMKTRKPHKIDATRNETFTWVKIGGKWMAQSLRASDERISVDGHPMPMAVPLKHPH